MIAISPTSDSASATGLFVPDMLGTFTDRAWGLTAGLDRSMLLAFGLGADGSRRAQWSQPFMQHWDPTHATPALVLNATWVRVGNRVVFAPFDIRAKYIVTLDTFAALQNDTSWSPPVKDVSLTAAAVTSSRFPGVLAAFETRKSPQDRRRLFVDGGYVDASGALTAQEIYAALRDGLPGSDIDLILILLTGSQNDKEREGTKGAELKDLVAPVVTLFSVRRLLSRIAVRETIDKVDQGAVETITNLAHPTQMTGSDRWKIMTVELNHDDFKLELGWKLSNLTYDIVSLQLGQADLCNKAKVVTRATRGPLTITSPTAGSPPATSGPRGATPGMPELSETPSRQVLPQDDAAPEPPSGKEIAAAEKRDKALEVAKTIRANSCVMASIEKLIGLQ